MDLKKKRQEEIIYAAMIVFSKNGFEGSKMESIADEAGIGKGTIYGYFSSKRELFEEMIYYNLDEYKKELSKIVEDKNSFFEKLEKLFKHYSRFISRNLDIFQIIKNNRMFSASMEENVIKKQKIIVGLIKDMIEKGIANGEIRKSIDQEVLALCIIGSINQLVNKRIFIDKMDVDKIDFTVLTDILMQGLVI